MVKKASVKRKMVKRKKPSEKKLPSLLDLIGTGAGEMTVEEAKKLLDEMRAEDDD
jgi:hypothetical protein